ncbi:hypothetical protein B0H14DRAFT_1711395 [Mycena olivaceomarginata]|nr:hypothetical protein B0H14DRAFT_1711395 [Mycena olivaceomarginata]
MTLPLQSAIHNLMTSTNLRSLKLNRIFDVPPSIIVQALSSLRTLGLYRVIVKPSETDVLDRPVTLRTEKIILRTLYPNIKSIVDLILPDIPTPGYLDNIKWLVVSMDGSFTRVESRRLIAATASTLCHLELRCQMFETILDLPTLPVLQLLELKISLGFGAPLPPNLYLAVAALPTAVPAIEILRLTFNAIFLVSIAWRTTTPAPFPCSTMPHTAKNFRVCGECIAAGGRATLLGGASTSAPTSIANSLDCVALKSSRFLFMVMREQVTYDPNAMRAHLEDGDY